MEELCCLKRLKNLINQPTCYKNSEKPTCIDLILTNQTTLFQHSTVLETELFDFYLLKVTELEMNFKNAKMQAPYCYLSELQCKNDAYRSEIQIFCSLNETDSGLFKESIFYILNEHASVRQKDNSHQRSHFYD